MKKKWLTFLFAVFAGFLSAQNVNFPDVNLKNKLIALGVDVDADGEIQLSEAAIPTSLDISSAAISSLTGLDAFVSLTELNCANNLLTSIDVSFFPLLTTLSCGDNAIQNLDVSVCTNLQSLNVSNASSLETLVCSNPQLSSLDITGCMALLSLDASTSQLTVIDVSICPNLNTLLINTASLLGTLNCHGTAITNLDASSCLNLGLIDVSACLSLQSLQINSTLGLLDAHASSLPTLQMLNCPFLNTVLLNDCSNLQSLAIDNCDVLNAININNCGNLQSVNITNCPSPFNTIDVSTCPNLLSCDFSGTHIDHVDVSNCPNFNGLTLNNGGVITFFDCHGTSISQLDVSNGGDIYNLDCHGTPMANLILSPNILSLNCANCQLTNVDLSNSNINFLNCSNNQISNLNLNNALNIKRVDCSNNQISSLSSSNFASTMLPFFTTLICANNPLTNLTCFYPSDTLDVSNCANLTDLYCGGTGHLYHLFLTGCTALTHLNVHTTSLSNLDISDCVNLQVLDCHNLLSTGSGISSLDISNAPNLDSVDCSYSGISSLDLVNNYNLNYLNAAGNGLSLLDATPCSSLIYLNCANNNLSQLDVLSCQLLEVLKCDSNQLTTLSVAGLIQFQNLTCSHNQLASLDVSNATSLENLDCSNNQLSNLDFSTIYNLKNINIFSNNFISFDASNFANLETLYGINENPLAYLFMKNGSMENLTNMDFNNSGSLRYICADPAQLIAIQQILDFQGVQNVELNSLCTYVSGGNINTITGNVKIDVDNNGCAAPDPNYAYLMTAVMSSIDTSYTCTNGIGNYMAFADAGNYVIMPVFDNATYFTTNAPFVSFPNNLNNQQIENICVLPNVVSPDVEITLSPITPARPGFYATYQLVYHNKGNTTASGDIILDFMGNKMTVVNTSNTPTSQTANQMVWAYSNLMPFESRSISFQMQIAPPTTNNVGDILVFNAHIDLQNETTPNDNYFALPQTLVSAIDPNDKTCLEGAQISHTKIGDYLHYLIRFQNTGNFYAEKVVVIDSLDANVFDISSFRILQTSHAMQMRILDNVAEFHFSQIMLPDSFSNEPASHGYVLFKIKTKANLSINSSVSNQADIYFDYNAPLATNTATSTFYDATSIDSPTEITDFELYPNPVDNMLNIKVSQGTAFFIYNSMGEMVLSKNMQGMEKWDISALNPGVYWIKAQNSPLAKAFIKK